MRASARAVICALLLAALPGRAGAHGGEDHGHAEAPPAAAAGAQADRLTTFGQTEQFELLLKYPPPESGKPGALRLYLSDFATNRPISDAVFELSFTPGGVKVAGAPVMRAPGVYELTATFPADTVYTLVATVTAGPRTDFIEVRNIYTGAAAERFLADHGGGSGVPAGDEEGGKGALTAMIVTLVTGGTTLIAALLRRRRKASGRGGDGAGRAVRDGDGRRTKDHGSTDTESGEDRT